MKKTVIQQRILLYTSRLNMYLAAEQAILEGAQEYQIGSRRLKRADLSEIRKEIEALTKDIDELESALAGNGFRRCVRGLPRDV